MSQKGVEGLIGRLVTDQDLRRRFFKEPVEICVKGRFDVTVREIEAILALEESEVEELSRKLDTRIVRAGGVQDYEIGSANQLPLADDTAQEAGQRRTARAGRRLC